MGRGPTGSYAAAVLQREGARGGGSSRMCKVSEVRRTIFPSHWQSILIKLHQISCWGVTAPVDAQLSSIPQGAKGMAPVIAATWWR
jgi:hypothetical protein